jgi:hypothetical protein
MNITPGQGHGWLGLVLEEEEYEGQVGTWVWYFEDNDQWRWYSFDERYNVEVISESR